MKNFLKSRTIQAALITSVVVVVGWLVVVPQIQQNHSGSGDNVAGNKVTNYNNSELSEVREIDHILIKLTYKEPILFPEDICDDDVCTGEYIMIGEGMDTIRIDPRQCTEFRPTSYRFDTGPYNPETGKHEQLISDWTGIEIRTCGWFDLPKDRILSKENILYQRSIEKKIDNYNTYKSDGSIIVQ